MRVRYGFGPNIRVISPTDFLTDQWSRECLTIILQTAKADDKTISCGVAQRFEAYSLDDLVAIQSSRGRAVWLYGVRGGSFFVVRYADPTGVEILWKITEPKNLASRPTW